jgi:citrate lyase beta subunit
MARANFKRHPIRSRSWLCASALNGRLLEKARSVDADIAHVDLEDSVPRPLKERARKTLIEHLGGQPAIRTAVRINSLQTIAGLRDLMFLAEHRLGPDVIILPKLSIPGDVNLARSILDEAGLDQVRIFGIVETVRTLWELRSIGHLPGLHGLIFGAADFAADIHVQLDKADFSFIQQEIALTAHRMGAIAVDSPCFDLTHEAVLRREIEIARSLGFIGKIAIHPSQVPIINRAFGPSVQALANARRLLRAHAKSAGAAVLRFEGAMVGPPFLRYARYLAAQCGGANQPMERKSAE